MGETAKTKKRNGRDASDQRPFYWPLTFAAGAGQLSLCNKTW